MRIAMLIPLLVAVLFIGLSSYYLRALPDRQKEYPILNKPLPEFELTDLDNPALAFTPQTMHGKYALLNIFGSWCVSCQAEHPVLNQMQRYNLRIYGINWKDLREDAQLWLQKHGNPYESVGWDPEGKAVIALGVTGAPETFLINPEGIILYRYQGPLTHEIVQNEILPRIQ